MQDREVDKAGASGDGAPGDGEKSEGNVLHKAGMAMSRPQQMGSQRQRVFIRGIAVERNHGFEEGVFRLDEGNEKSKEALRGPVRDLRMKD